MAENDILRDCGEAYGRKLNEAGVPVVSIPFNRMTHDWGLLNTLATVPSTGQHDCFPELRPKEHLQNKKWMVKKPDIYY